MTMAPRGINGCIFGLGMLMVILALSEGVTADLKELEAVMQADYVQEELDSVGTTLPTEAQNSDKTRPARNLIWVAGSEGRVPEGAVVGGRTANGEILYIGRMQYKNDLLAGKVHPSHHRLYVSHDGREVGSDSYEVLVEVKPSVCAE